MQQLTQEQLNVAIFLRGLIDLTMINIDSQYGFGRQTRELVKSHIDGWDYHNRKQLYETLQSVLEMLPEVKLNLESIR